ncbi:F-box domain-containing protein [Favolaschia claudopus]|uniref:F-box domain-containing protein n=1 Tax=Favolaschia claudopus TaxID=2862362 RepID=A0AAV9ZDI9_9AGAR
MLTSLEADRRRIPVLETQILELQQALLALQTEKDVVQSRLDGYRYPVLTLPNEIISEIFLCFIPSYPHPPPLAGSTSPTLLTHICRTWREIAIAIPQLWRALDFTDEAPIIPLEQQKHLGALWIERSKACLICVRLIGSLPALSALVPYMPRCEHLSLSLNALCSSMLYSSMPLLRVLGVDLMDVNEGYTHCRLTFCDTPKLHTVVLKSFIINHIDLPWSQLTSLSLIDAFARETEIILRQTPHLVHLAVDFLSRDSLDDNPVYPDIELLHVQICNLHSELGSPYPEFFHSLVTPSLEHLQLSGGFVEQDNHIDSLNSFISKSGCKLSHLLIKGQYAVTETYCEAFPSIPDIVCKG